MESDKACGKACNAICSSDIKRLERAGFRFAGPSMHSAIKVCTWTKRALNSKGFCYKQKFYGIQSHRCLQMTPAFPFCTHKCIFCWRDTTVTYPEWKGPVDSPVEILDSCIEAQRKILQGFGGNPDVSEKVFREAMEPNQVAISLAGEPTMYPRLPELVDEINSRNMTSFLVTNGTFPEMIEKLTEHQPYQLYITLPAPDEKTYNKTCLPVIKNGWDMLNKSLSMLRNFDCNTVVRLTLVKGLNLVNPEKYAEIIERASPKFVEVKSFMSVGFSRQRLPYADMPLHKDIREFSCRIEKASGFSISDEKHDSRVILMTRK